MIISTNLNVDVYDSVSVYSPKDGMSAYLVGDGCILDQGNHKVTEIELSVDNTLTFFNADNVVYACTVEEIGEVVFVVE